MDRLPTSGRRSASRLLRTVRIGAVAAVGCLGLVSLLVPRLVAEPGLRLPLRYALVAIGAVLVFAAWGFEVADPPQSQLRCDVLWGIAGAILVFVGLSPFLF